MLNELERFVDRYVPHRSPRKSVIVRTFHRPLFMVQNHLRQPILDDSRYGTVVEVEEFPWRMLEIDAGDKRILGAS
jgi:hypothetical protein